ncbi:MAG: hypothetical protein JRI68_26780, partial [Deltaproteobacteria bacterium]|nr:hypothetical protein [Deltaproteobacteria bacterium]
MVGWWRHAVPAAALVGATLVVTPAAADEDDDDGIVALPALLLDGGFAAYGVAAAFRGQPVGTAVLVPQLI